jgi:hypothetical protein
MKRLSLGNFISCLAHPYCITSYPLITQNLQKGGVVNISHDIMFFKYIITLVRIFSTILILKLILSCVGGMRGENNGF